MDKYIMRLQRVWKLCKIIIINIGESKLSDGKIVNQRRKFTSLFGYCWDIRQEFLNGEILGVFGRPKRIMDVSVVELVFLN